MKLHPVDVIVRKRDGHRLTDAEIADFLAGVVGSDGAPPVTEAQTAAWLMAVFLRGLDPGELAALTQAMRVSGEVFDSAPLRTTCVDKHSTGGVGDKTSLLLAPILAALGQASPTADGVPGLCVPMISGRSLGHTGGTLDKLETIPGFDTQLGMEQMTRILRAHGAALAGQTPSLVPADRILYALRDHTGTVASPYLMTASIMSKKLAEGLDALVLDVKTGSGAFMQQYTQAHELAELMVATGERAGTRTVALVTTMDQPLGRYAGNWLEVLECVEILQGRAHPRSARLLELTYALCGWLLVLAGRAPDATAGAAMAAATVQDGSAYRAWLGIVAAQGGDVRVFDDGADFHRPRASRILRASRTGYLAAMDCTQVGWAVQRLGAGRAKPGDPVSAHAGIEVHVELGDSVADGQPLLTLFADSEEQLEEPYAMLGATYRVDDTRPTLPPLVQAVVGG